MTRLRISELFGRALLLFSLFHYQACDQGLSPESAAMRGPVYGISGTIYFTNWPPSDSVLDLRVVSFKNFPSQDIIDEVLQGRAGYTETIQPYGADSLHYTLLLSPIPPGAFTYTVVAQRFGPNIRADWKAVGEYYANGDTSRPGTIIVPADSVLPGADIRVDFRKPPRGP
jgi:hypothetical protein